MVFPIAKLVSLAVKQLSKPVAKYAKEGAKRSVFFRRYVCMPPAQLYHWMEVRLKMRILGLGKTKPGSVPQLNEEMATELGAEMLGEFIVFMVAVATIYGEYWRQARNAQQKEDTQNQRLNELEEKLLEVQVVTEKQDMQIRHLSRLLAGSTPDSSQTVRLPGK
ncbi:PREDICTED: optic atrophy 3 protein homolog [Branchiostoma belcheri]|uniref:Optic atrophy 3 protein homolog n=1 Tax=Branchiostoma belcheri TaxID=7741 RepID=A0A6P4ZS45_BRABE|nr:PREDICTED: optic atrophy 3 protein homolog [Branchiostoma belcheri]KAI8514719.1 Optic atrophy 3 protein [Branchiostoma belcheri]